MANQQEIVYHYTSMETLLKIVETGVIWATNIRYLNDVLERRHCLSLIKKRLQSCPPLSPTDQELLQHFQDDEENKKPFYGLPFVASFSQERDSLPQWRSYCPQGNGVCIGIRTDSLLKAFVAEEPDHPALQRTAVSPVVFFERVRYLEPDNTDVLDELIEQIRTEARERVSSSTIPTTEIKLLWYLFNTYASRIKHDSFSSEIEYRLIVTTIWRYRNSIRFRISRSTLVPYISISLPEPATFISKPRDLFRPTYLSGTRPFFIDSVTIGPTPHMDLSEDAVNAFFSQLNLGVWIQKSIVPFRDL